MSAFLTNVELTMIDYYIIKKKKHFQAQKSSNHLKVSYKNLIECYLKCCQSRCETGKNLVSISLLLLLRKFYLTGLTITLGNNYILTFICISIEKKASFNLRIIFLWLFSRYEFKTDIVINNIIKIGYLPYFHHKYGCF